MTCCLSGLIVVTVKIKMLSIVSVSYKFSLLYVYMGKVNRLQIWVRLGYINESKIYKSGTSTRLCRWVQNAWITERIMNGIKVWSSKGVVSRGRKHLTLFNENDFVIIIVLWSSHMKITCIEHENNAPSIHFSESGK